MSLLSVSFWGPYDDASNNEHSYYIPPKASLVQAQFLHLLFTGLGLKL